jgi:hypothetical protein
MNVCCTDVMPMPAVQTMTVLLSVGVELDFLEMDLLVQVCNLHFCGKNVKACHSVVNSKPWFPFGRNCLD